MFRANILGKFKFSSFKYFLESVLCSECQIGNIAKQGLDEDMAVWLWNVSEKLTKLNSKSDWTKQLNSEFFIMIFTCSQNKRNSWLKKLFLHICWMKNKIEMGNHFGVDAFPVVAQNKFRSITTQDVEIYLHFQFFLSEQFHKVCNLIL